MEMVLDEDLKLKDVHHSRRDIIDELSLSSTQQEALPTST